MPGRLRGAVRETLAVLDRVRPDVVVGYGGYVSVPAYLAARRRRLPLVVHEQNALPGLANKVGARIARRVAVSFPDTPLRNAEYVGLPIRRMISTLDRAAIRAEAARSSASTPTGRPCWSPAAPRAPAGSTRPCPPPPGARRRRRPGAARRRPERRGRAGAQRRALRRRAFVDRMDLAYAAADLVVCRAGANSVTEAAAVGLPAVFVPLPIGNGEQDHNARPVVDAGGGLLVADGAFTPEWVAATVPALATDAGRGSPAMGAAAAGLIPRDADEKLARIVLEAAAR